MRQVKCFRTDEWVSVDVIDLEIDDIISLNGASYLVKGQPYKDDEGKDVVPAEVLEEGPIILDLGSPEKEHINRVMDLVNTDMTDFKDGTFIMGSVSGDNMYTYSPRLSLKDLNDFCRENIDHFKEFYNKHAAAIDNGKSLYMEHFWKKGDSK